MNKTSFGKVKNVLLFGGGQVLRHVCLKLLENGFSVQVYSAKRLLEEKHDKVSLQEFLKKNNVPFESTADINQSDRLKGMIGENSIGISFGAPWIFKKELLERFNGRLLNSHSMSLPRNRGGGGFSWMILNQDRKTASLLHVIDQGLDTGPILKKREFLFPETCKIPKDFEEAKLKSDKEFFNEFIEELAQGKEFELEKQDESKSSYFPRLHTKTQGLIDWSWTKEEIARFIDAFDDPYPGSSTFLNGKRLFLKKSSIPKEKDRFHPFMAGLVYRNHGNKLFIATANGSISVSEARDEQGNSLIKQIQPGQRFFTPKKFLEEAISFRPVYTSEGLKK